MSLEFIARNGIISRGNIIVTGSLTASGSLALTNIGSSVFSGSITQIASTASFGGLVNIGTTASRFNLTIPDNGRIGSDYVSDSYITLGNAIGLVANYNVYTLRNLAVGAGDISARLGVKGSGATSSTTSFLVQNANASSSLIVTDDRNVEIQGGLTVTGTTGSWIIEARGTSNSGGIRRVGNNVEFFGLNYIGGFLGGYGSLNIRGYSGGSTGNTTTAAATIADGFNYNASSVNTPGLTISPAINQTGTGTFTLLNFAPTFNTTGSGVSYYISSSNYVVTSLGDVGIKTGTPSASLHISGSSNSVLLEVDSPAVNNILFVSGSGNVGIGTATPSYTLDVSGVIRSSISNGVNFYGNTTDPKIYLNTSQGAEISYQTWGFSAVGGWNQIGGNTIIGANLYRVSSTTPSARLHVVGSGTTSSTTALLVQNSNASASLAVLNDGYVGVGTSSPSYPFHVRNTSAQIIAAFGNDNTNSRIAIGYGAGGGHLIEVGSWSGYGGIQNSVINGLLVIQGTSGGNTVIGNTTNPGYKLHVSGSGNFTNNLTVTGSFTVTTGSTVEFQVNQTGVKIGNATTDSHSVTGSIAVSASAGSGSALSVYKSGSTVLDVQGSSGQLFSVTDSLTGSLFSVNTVAGLPVMEAFSDNTVNIGKFNTYPIKVVATGSLANITGSFSGSLVGSVIGTTTTASFALTASYVNPLVQNVLVTGSISSTSIITGTGTNNYTGIVSTAAGASATLGYGGVGATGGTTFDIFQNNSAAIAIAQDKNVGIGAGSGNAAYGIARLLVKGSGTTSSTTSLLVQNANASSSLTVLDNGFVGIGISSPTAPLYVSYATASSTDFVINNSIASGAGPATRIRFINPVSSLNKTSGIINSYFGGNSYVASTIELKLATNDEVLENVLVANGNKSVYIYGTTTPAAVSNYTVFRLNRPTFGGPAYGGTVDFNLGMWSTANAPSANTQLQIRMSSGLSETADTNALTINASASLALIGINTTTPSASLDVSGSGRFTNGLTITGSLTATSLTASSAVINGNVTVLGTASIAFLNVTYESASVIYSSGSNQLGDAENDTQLLYGNVIIPTGSLIVTGSVNITGSAGAITVGRATSTVGLVHIQKPANSTLANLYLATPYPSTTPTNIIFQNNNFGGGDTGTGSISWDVGGTYFNISNRTLIGSSPTSIDLTPGSVIGLSRVGAGDLQLNFLQSGIASYVIRNVSGQKALAFITDGVTTTTAEAARFTANSNFLVGTTSDVARVVVKGSGTTSSTNALLVQNSNNSSSFYVRDDGAAIVNTALFFASDGSGGNYLNFYRAGVNNWIMGSAGIGDVLQISGNSIILAQDTTIQRGGLTVSPTITSASPLRVNHTWNDASTVFATLDINVTNTLSQTGSKLIDVAIANTSSFVLDRNFNLGIKTSTPSASLHVVGNTILSGSAGTGSALQVYKSGSTVMSIQGSQGELFSITDSLSGSLFSVSNISGLPILEVFSDNTTLVGDYLAPALITTKKTTVNSGSTVIYNLPTASYDGGFFDYTIRSGSNARAGQIMAIWSGTSVNHTEIVTSDFGNTNGFTFGSIVSGSNMALTSSASTSGWTLKTIIRSI